MKTPPRLVAGDELRVLALSRSLGGVMRYPGFTREDVAFATKQLVSVGLKVTFGRYAEECNPHLTAEPEHRLEDFHKAIAAPNVKAILAVSGGQGAIQLLDGLDYRSVTDHPKIICGYSDNAFVLNAVTARSGVVTYYGPNFTSFMMRSGGDYTLKSFQRCLFQGGPDELQPSNQWSDDAWHSDQEHRTFHPNDGLWPVQSGEGQGTIYGGSIWCFTFLQGSPYFPPLENSILFLELVPEGKATLMALDTGLRALSFQPGFGKVRGIVLGRFPRACGITLENLRQVLSRIEPLNGLPIAANVDFGHTTPMLTLPLGARCTMQVSDDPPRVSLRTDS